MQCKEYTGAHLHSPQSSLSPQRKGGPGLGRRKGMKTFQRNVGAQSLCSFTFRSRRGKCNYSRISLTFPSKRHFLGPQLLCLLNVYNSYHFLITNFFFKLKNFWWLSNMPGTDVLKRGGDGEGSCKMESHELRGYQNVTSSVSSLFSFFSPSFWHQFLSWWVWRSFLKSPGQKSAKG